MVLAYGIDTSWEKGEYRCYFDLGPYRSEKIAADIAKKVLRLRTYGNKAVVELSDGEMIYVDHKHVIVIKTLRDGDIDFSVTLPKGLESLIEDSLSFSMTSSPKVIRVNTEYEHDIID